MVDYRFVCIFKFMELELCMNALMITCLSLYTNSWN